MRSMSLPTDRCHAPHPLGMRCTRPDQHHGDHRSGELAWKRSPADEITTATAHLVDALRDRGDQSLTIAIGTTNEPVLLTIAIDGSAHRLREAITEYLNWPCAAWTAS